MKIIEITIILRTTITATNYNSQNEIKNDANTVTIVTRTSVTPVQLDNFTNDIGNAMFIEMDLRQKTKSKK